MSDTILTPIRRQNPFEAARLGLIKKLLEIKAPGSFSNFPHPSEFSTVAEHIRQTTRFFDEWLSELGHQIADNSTCAVDQQLFLSAFTDAIDGNALYECERASEALIEEHDEMMRAS